MTRPSHGDKAIPLCLLGRRGTTQGKGRSFSWCYDVRKEEGGLRKRTRRTPVTGKPNESLRPTRMLSRCTLLRQDSAGDLRS